ncbi:hypothetical protein Goari_026716 [Gossypium aridum]|uniref:Uncharacterized protein n=1 Tax=Gossypium aridum TaxID=34290 RepID=A0A7J8XCX5_GOSAI|nr:hypothetical protein [Gossypium aridum]
MERRRRKCKIEEQIQIDSATNDNETPIFEPDLIRAIFKQIWIRKAQGFFATLSISPFFHLLISILSPIRNLKTKGFWYLNLQSVKEPEFKTPTPWIPRLELEHLRRFDPHSVIYSRSKIIRYIS